MLTFAVAALAITWWAPRVRSVRVDVGEDFELAASTTGQTTSLSPGDVTGFHLERDAEAGGRQIKNVAPGTVAGEALTHGTAVVSSTFVGAYPGSVTYATGVNLITMDMTLPAFTFVAPGACTEDAFAVPEADLGEVVGVTLQTVALPNGVMAASYIDQFSGLVIVRRCAVVAVAATARSARLTVVQ